jgi:hypothetical protein
MTRKEFWKKSIAEDCPANHLDGNPGRADNLLGHFKVGTEIHEGLTTRSLIHCSNYYSSFHSEVKL